MIEISAGQLYPAMQAVQELMRRDVPARIALRLASIHRAMEPVAKDIAEREAAIFREAGAEENDFGFVPQQDKEGNDIPGSIKVANPEGLEAKLRDLRESPVAVSAALLEVNWLESAGIQITGEQAYLLGDLLAE